MWLVTENPTHVPPTGSFVSQNLDSPFRSEKGCSIKMSELTPRMQLSDDAAH